MKTSLRICSGPDCKTHKKRNSKIEALIEPHCKVRKMKCQDYCDGPVVRVRRGNERFWFSRIRGKGLREDLLIFVQEGTLSRRLKRCREHSAR